MKDKSYTDTRRKDRAQNDGWIKEFLRKAPHGVLASVHDGQPFQNMNIFVYDEPTQALYMHTAGHGRTRSNVTVDHRVSFCVSHMGRLLPAVTAKEMSVEFASVIVFGRGSIVEDKRLARDKMQQLIEKYFPHLEAGTDYRAITPAEIDEVSTFKVAIESWSGKRKSAEADFPGALRYKK